MTPFRFKQARPAPGEPQEQEQYERKPQPTPEEQEIEDNESPETEEAESLMGVEADREADEASMIKERLQGYNAQSSPGRQVNPEDIELIKFILAKLLKEHEGAEAVQPQQPQGMY